MGTIVNRQNPLKINRQPSKMQINQLTIKKFQGIQISLFQLIFRESGFWINNLLTGKTSSHVLKTTLDIKIPFILLVSESPEDIYFLVLWVKGEDNLH